jgi:RNA-directed DNA polymerase
MVVNGTEDVALEWDAVDWRLHEDNVGRLRRRIFKAAKDEDLAKVRSLQKMMLRSWSNTLVSVRQVTQRNTGRETAGIDGEVALTSPARIALAVRVHQSIRTWKPVPVKRVYIPKASDRAKLRPLGIPVLMDRCHQARAKNALEPEWEARFEPRSYGFRPGRSCQDAIEAIYDTCKGRGAARVWTLDADLAAAFDKLDHSHLLSAIGSFPGREMIRAWLTAGVFEPGKGFAPTEEGSPQGGVISPCLLNVALHGLEEAAGVRYGPDGIRIAKGSPVLVRYCDDFVVCCHTRQQAEQVKARLAGWLAPRGLAFNDEKTKIVSLESGYDFLGFNIRRYRNGKLLIKPSKAAIRRVKHKLAEQMRRLRGQNASAVLAAICPITRGWASYYRSVVSKKTFAAVDDYLWQLTYKWACRSHPGKPKHWVVRRYFGRFNPSRQNNWVFGDAASGAYLPLMAWTPIIRHRKVTGRASPDDPALTAYWNQRRGRNQPPLDRSTLRLLKRQRGRCAICADLLLHADREPHTPEEWQRWHRTARKAITRQLIARGQGTTPDDARLIHTYCQRRATGADSQEPASSLTSTALRGLLEPDAVSAASPVLRGAGRGNASRLPDSAPSVGET